MFKNALVFTYQSPMPLSQLQLEEAFDALRFAPCGPTQDKSAGWVSPRGEQHGALVESIGGQWIARFMVETKTVPGAVVKRHLAERVAQIQEKEGRKPGKKESREISEEIIRQLLPNAFPKTAAHWVWIDPNAGRIVLDVSSMSKADEIITALVRLIPNLHIALLNTQHSPQAAMVQWLTSSPDAWPGDLALGRYVELKSADEMKSLVKFDRHHLEDEQMKLHIGQGKLPTQLALEWAGRVSFVLTEGLVFKKIAFMDDVIEGQGDDEGGFDADAAIATGELDKVITGMIDALGGVMN